VEAARNRVLEQVLDGPMSSDADADTAIQPAFNNFKSALQELAQARNLPQPRYTMLREKGPEHAKTFTVEVRVDKDWNGQAEGRTKKLAAQRAARGVYERLLAAQPLARQASPAEQPSPEQPNPEQPRTAHPSAAG